jgi:hypothetical protein
MNEPPKPNPPDPQDVTHCPRCHQPADAGELRKLNNRWYCPECFRILLDKQDLRDEERY